mgnify:CR=1 FL=1|jgi:transcription elongation factor GreA
MDTQSTLLGDLKETLIKHLVEVEERGESLIEELSPVPYHEREELKQTLREYINKVEDLIKTSHLIEDNGNFPLVIIGSRVAVEEINTTEHLVFQIISPFGDLPGENGVSPLSPVGKALLLQKPGVKVIVNAPGGTFHYRIEAIKYPLEI